MIFIESTGLIIDSCGIYDIFLISKKERV